MIDIIENKEELNDFLKTLDKRGAVDNNEYLPIVMEILENVKKNGDNAVLEYTKKFDEEGF